MRYLTALFSSLKLSKIISMENIHVKIAQEKQAELRQMFLSSLDNTILDNFIQGHNAKMEKYKNPVPEWLAAEARVVSVIEKLRLLKSPLPTIRHNCNSTLFEGFSEYRFFFDLAFFAAPETAGFLKYKVQIKPLLEGVDSYQYLFDVILGNLDEKYKVGDIVLDIFSQTNPEKSRLFYHAKKAVYEKIVNHLLDFWDANDLNYILNDYLPFLQKENII